MLSIGDAHDVLIDNPTALNTTTDMDTTNNAINSRSFTLNNSQDNDWESISSKSFQTASAAGSDFE